MKEQGFEMVQTAVGDRYVLERMLEDGAVIGGEQSGHIIFLEHNTTGDGLVTALQLLAVLKRTGRTLTDLAGIMKKYPQVLVNVHSDNKAGWMIVSPFGTPSLPPRRSSTVAAAFWYVRVAPSRWSV